MDYQYFPAAPQPYFQIHALGLPPTPVHTSDEYSNSPPEFFDQYQSFDYNSHQHLNPSRTSKITTPIPSHTQSIAQDEYKMQFDDNEDINRRGSNSDDEDQTPAQARRKAQNRAAQRAFRERKERHVKDLEAKLAALSKNTDNLTVENERLKLQLAKAATENEILKATTSHSVPPASPLASTGPLHYSPTDFYSNVLHQHENKVPSHRIVKSPEGQKLFAAGATWDYIMGHELYRRGLVDVGDVSERLKRRARCDGQGPVFEEQAILEAIEQSVASGNDELL